MLTKQFRKSANAVIALPVPVILKSWQVVWAAHAGAQRTKLNKGKVEDKPDYKDKEDALQPDIVASTASCLCELAVSIYLNQRWNGPYWDPKKHHGSAKQAPDVGHNIEVRRTRTLGSEIPVHEHEATKNLQLVQAYIDDKEIAEVLDWAEKGIDYFDYVTIILTGTVPAEIAWNNGAQTYEDKRTCPARFFSSVAFLRQAASN